MILNFQLLEISRIFLSDEFLQDPFSVYKSYVLTKLHFTTKYDIKQYRNKLKNITREQYDRRRDKLFFINLAKTLAPNETQSFFVSQFIESSNLYIADIVINSSIANSIFIKWKARIANIKENYENDMKSLKQSRHDWSSLFVNEDRNYPLVFRMVTSGIIAPETYSLMNDLFKQCDKEYDVANQSLFDAVQHKFKRYRCFLPMTVKEVLRLTPKRLN